MLNLLFKIQHLFNLVDSGCDALKKLKKVCRIKQTFRPRDQPPTIFNKLPLEIWLCIAEHLPLSSTASLALTNHHMYYFMQPLHPLERLRHLTRRPKQFESEDNHRSRLDFLQLIERTYPGQMFCHACKTIHRVHSVSRWLEPSRREWDPRGEIYKIIDCKPWKENYDYHVSQHHCIFQFWAYKYWLTFHLVMHAHRLGVEYGIPLSDNQHTKPINVNPSDAKRVNHGSRLPHRPWKTDFRAVIVDGKLLIQERMFRTVSRGSWTSPRASDRGWEQLEICRHDHNKWFVYQRSCFTKIQGILTSLEQKASINQIMTGELQRCNSCPTEWQLHLIPREACENTSASRGGDLLIPDGYPSSSFQWLWKEYLVVFVRYCDLGECRSSTDPNWAALMSEYGPTHGYPYLSHNAPNIKARFEAALCDTIAKAS